MLSVAVRVPGEFRPGGGSVRASNGNLGKGPRSQPSQGSDCHKQQSGVTRIHGENGKTKVVLRREVTLHVGDAIGHASLCTLVVSSSEV